MTRTILIASLLLLSGCAVADMMIQPEDSIPEVTGKVVFRTLMFVPSFGLTEFAIATEKRTRECESIGGWYFAGGCRANTQGNRDRAMMMLPYVMQNNTAIIRGMQQPLQPMTPTPQPQLCGVTQYGSSSTITCY